jgi:hypothetical protein
MTDTPFISWIGHGAAELAPPGVFTGAKASAFVIEADQQAMQRTADLLLNPAGGGQVRYEVLAGVSMVTFMDIAKCTSTTETVGWLPGREAAFWVPLLETHPGNPLRDRLVLWAPYIFINYTIGMVTGREGWGWPKTLGVISVASDDPTRPRYGCVTTYFPTLADATQGVTGSLFGIAAETPQPVPTSIWKTGAEAVAALVGAALGDVAGSLTKAFDLTPQAPCVALKQIRDTSAPTMACYQAIVDSPVELTNFQGGGLLPGNFTLEITTCESHQIVQDLLGRVPDPESTKVPVKFAIWSEVDFQALAGSNIVVVT